MKNKAELFFFAVIFTANLAMLFQVIKITSSPAYKRGLEQTAQLMVK